MTSNTTAEPSGNDMSDDELETFLYEHGDGVLSFAKDGVGYGVPISFGYDGDRLFIHLIQFGDASEKLDFNEHTTQVSLTAYTTDSRFDWQSVILRGTLSEIPESDIEYMESIMDQNAWKPRLSPMDESVEAVQRVELDISEATGKRRAAMSS